MAPTAGWLEQDPDQRVVRWGWLLWVAWGVIAGALFLEDVRGGTGSLSLILIAPFWVMWMLWPLYRGVRVWWRWQFDGSEWNGTYYEFDGLQIRVLMQGDSIWIVADDVFDALRLRGRQRDPARVREIAGRDGLIKPPGSARLAFSEVGIKAWLDRRTDIVAHKFSYWLDKQVIGPYRTRLEIAGHRGIENDE